MTKAGEILNKYAEEEHISLRKQALKIGLSPSYLCDIYYGHREVSSAVLVKIVQAYKYKCKSTDLATLITECIGEDIIRRYKTRVHELDAETALKNIFFILYGVNL